MFNWFKKKDDKRLDEFENSVKNSFQNMKSDMSHVSKWITHFKSRHDEHNSKIEELNQRLQLLESLINSEPKIVTGLQKVRVQEEEEGLLEEEETGINIKSSNRDLSTLFSETQNKVFGVLCSLVLESSSKWISMRALADEAYRGYGGYEKNRSLISQFITLYEINGLVERKRVGKETYITVIKTLKGRDFNSIVNLQKKIQKIKTEKKKS
jgi:hypothetical protein